MRTQRIKAGVRHILGLRTASRLAAWACIMAITALSLAPAEQMLRTGLSGRAEHALAYAGTAFITTVAYGQRGTSWVTLSWLAYAGVLESLQHFSPGRTPSFEDYVFSGAGILMGVAVYVLVRKWGLSSVPGDGRVGATR